jgi:L-fucose mutarotase/ribose pyranase (RbsD/FucU family)
VSERIEFELDPNDSLPEVWQQVAAQLERGGAQDYQLESMKMTFYIGAAQAFGIVMANARGSRELFDLTMRELATDINAVLPKPQRARGRA